MSEKRGAKIGEGSSFKPAELRWERVVVPTAETFLFCPVEHVLAPRPSDDEACVLPQPLHVSLAVRASHLGLFNATTSMLLTLSLALNMNMNHSKANGTELYERTSLERDLLANQSAMLITRVSVLGSLI